MTIKELPETNIFIAEDYQILKLTPKHCLYLLGRLEEIAKYFKLGELDQFFDQTSDENKGITLKNKLADVLNKITEDFDLEKKQYGPGAFKAYECLAFITNINQKILEDLDIEDLEIICYKVKDKIISLRIFKAFLGKYTTLANMTID